MGELTKEQLNVLMTFRHTLAKNHALGTWKRYFLKNQTNFINKPASELTNDEIKKIKLTDVAKYVITKVNFEEIRRFFYNPHDIISRADHLACALRIAETTFLWRNTHEGFDYWSRIFHEFEGKSGAKTF